MRDWNDACDEAFEWLLGGALAQAEAAFRDLLTHARPGSADRVRALEGLAIALGTAWRYPEALSYFQEARAEHLRLGCPPSEPIFLVEWARCLLDEGDPVAAAARLTEALEQYGEDPELSPWRLQALATQVTLALRAQDPATAARLVQDMVALFEAAAEEVGVYTFDMALQVAESAVEAGCLRMAELLGVRSLALARRMAADEVEPVATALLQLAELYQRLEQRDLALAFLDEAVAVQEATHGPDAPPTLLAKAERALALAKVDPAAARAQLAMVIAACDQDPLATQGLLVTQLVNLAGMWLAEGRPREALPHLERGAAIARAAEVSVATLGTVYGSLASCLFELDRYEQAMVASHEAEALLCRRVGPEHVELAPLYHNRASFLLSKGELEEAEAMFQRALELAERGLPPGDPGRGHILEGLLMLYRQMGDRVKFERYAARRIEAARAQGGPEEAERVRISLAERYGV